MATHPTRPVDIGDYRKIRLKPNKQGYYEVWWSDAARRYATRRESCRTQVLAQAEAYLHHFCDAARQQTAALTQPTVLTVEYLCGQWLAYVEPLGKARTGRYVLTPVMRLLGHHRPNQLAGQPLRDYAALRGGGIADGTIRRELTALKTVLLWAVEEQLLTLDQVPPFKRVTPPVGPPRTKFLTDPQESFFWDRALLWGTKDHGSRQLRDAAYRVMLFVALGLGTAARREAIMDLTWDRVDLAQRRIDYHKPGRRITKKRRVTGLPISDRLLPILKEAWLKAPKDTRGEATGRVLGDATHIEKAFSRFAESVGLPWVTPHVLRHTWASLAAMAGVPMFEIAKFMGDTMATVEAHYAHLAPDHLRGAANFKTSRPQAAAVA